MSETLRDMCRGRWRGLLTLFGVDKRFLTGRHSPCPMCAGRDRFRFDDKDGVGTWICTNCGAGDGFSLLMKLKGWDFKEVASRVQEVLGNVPREMEMRQDRNEKSLREAMNRLWREGTITQPGDVVASYLEARGIVLETFPTAVRTVTKCRYQDETPSFHPAMIAKVTGPDGMPVTIHRTYLDGNGGKAEVESPRRLMPGKLVKGSAIRLGEITPTLGIAEGIETALAASLVWGVTCWAAINSSMLMAWEPPQGVSELIVFGDNDPKYGGQSAAFALAHRLSVRGTSVRVEIPAEVGKDWNDMLLLRPDKGVILFPTIGGRDGILRQASGGERDEGVLRVQGE